MKLTSGQYYGEIFHALDANGVILTRSDYKKMTILPNHYHNNPYFCYVLEGNYTEESFQQKLNCSKGDIIFHPRETEHFNHFTNASVSCFNVELSGNWLEKLVTTRLVKKEIVFNKHPEVQNVLRKIYKEFITPDSISGLMIEGLTLELIANFSRKEKRTLTSSYYTKKVQQYIHENFPANPSLLELANLFHISPEYLSRVFKANTGTTIGEYIRQYKIDQACCKLKEKNADIHSIALECGFTDPSHFTKVFKKHMKLTPGMYKAIK